MTDHLYQAYLRLSPLPSLMLGYDAKREKKVEVTRDRVGKNLTW
jgi:hypothetical protein